MEISQLVTLVHVAELGSISKAADRLNTVQPALSRQIMLLEQELGVSLFERHGRGMAITEAGQGVLDHAVRVLAELDAMRRSVEERRTSFRGIVRIGTTPTVADIVTVPLMQRIREAHPNLNIRFSSAFSGYLLDWLKRGELDVVVSYDPPSTKALRVVPVMMEQLYLVSARPGLSIDKPLQFTSLADEQFVLPSPHHGLRAIVDEYARQAGIKYTHVVEADSFTALTDLTRAGFGVTILPLAPIYRDIREGRLFAAPLTNPTPERKLVVCYSADRRVSPSARYVGHAFTEIATELVNAGIWGGQILSSGGKV